MAVKGVCPSRAFPDLPLQCGASRTQSSLCENGISRDQLQRWLPLRRGQRTAVQLLQQLGFPLHCPFLGLRGSQGRDPPGVREALRDPSRAAGSAPGHGSAPGCAAAGASCGGAAPSGGDSRYCSGPRAPGSLQGRDRSPKTAGKTKPSARFGACWISLRQVIVF